MALAVYLSTGCFTGRPNGRDPHLLSKYHEKLNCDGFELMLYEEFYPKKAEIIREYTSLGINIPIVHFSKRIGDLLSTKGDSAFSEALEQTLEDCDIACSLGAARGVFHPWGIPDSDTHIDMICDRIAEIFEKTKSTGIELLPENCVCTHSSPLKNLNKLLKKAPCKLTVDTRAAHFHDEVYETLDAFLPDTVGHFHLIDYVGAPHDWQARRVICQPADSGFINFEYLLKRVKSSGFNGTLTLESSYMLEDGVACNIFNNSIEFIRSITD